MSDSFKICNKELHKRDRPKINYHYCASCKVMHVVGASVDISKPFNLEGVSGSVECVSVEMLKDTLRFCFSCWERGGVDRWVLDGRAGKANLSSDAKMDEIKKAHEVSVELASHVPASTRPDATGGEGGCGS